jgi:hypothetical protein
MNSFYKEEPHTIQRVKQQGTEQTYTARSCNEM